jgi:hypothetical protein
MIAWVDATRSQVDGQASRHIATKQVFGPVWMSDVETGILIDCFRLPRHRRRMTIDVQYTTQEEQ